MDVGKPIPQVTIPSKCITSCFSLKHGQPSHISNVLLIFHSFVPFFAFSAAFCSLFDFSATFFKS